MAKTRTSRIKSASDRETRYQETLDKYHDQLAGYLRDHPFGHEDTIGGTLTKVQIAAQTLQARTAASASSTDPMRAFLAEMDAEERKTERIREARTPPPGDDLTGDEEPVTPMSVIGTKQGRKDIH